MTLIKICGLSRPDDAASVNAVLPDYAGFVFFARSSRNVSSQTALELRGMIDPAVKTVGVFVDADISLIGSLVRSGTISIAQLHGHEDDDYVARLRGECGVEIWQARKVASRADAEAAERSRSDMILLDGGAGDGRTFDWSLLGGMSRPYFLAGGLTPDNAADAVRTLHPHGVDVSSGVESGGVKDAAKIARFVEAVRSCG